MDNNPWDSLSPTEKIVVWKRHLRAEMRPGDSGSTYSPCDCGKTSRTGTCAECIQRKIRELEAL